MHNKLKDQYKKMLETGKVEVEKEHWKVENIKLVVKNETTKPTIRCYLNNGDIVNFTELYNFSEKKYVSSAVFIQGVRSKQQVDFLIHFINVNKKFFSVVEYCVYIENGRFSPIMTTEKIKDWEQSLKHCKMRLLYEF